MADPAWRAQDRRADRIVPPSCSSCNDVTEMAVASRTDYVVYFRCEDCGQVQSVRKPHWKPDTTVPVLTSLSGGADPSGGA